ncbi:reverse transcriptase domain-containing protein [Tanacetum coccineum]
MVKKSDGGWRMCVDFTDINKACPKDCYPLPEIDWKVETLSGFCLKCFFDAYKGYHQIQMAEEDEDKTTLKNAGATYQRLVDKGDSNKETPKDFLIEAPPEDNRKEVGRKMDTKLEEMKPSYEWKVYTDGTSSSDGSGAGLMLIDPKGKECTYALRFEFETTNNEALLAGLRIAQEMEIVNLAIFVDSQLLVNQMKGIYAAKRNQKKKVDALIKLASMTLEHLTKEVLVEVLTRRSIEEKEVLQVETKEEESWMTPIHEYLLSSLLPEDSKVSRKIRIKAPQYKLIRGSLYKKSFYRPWLLCTYPPKTDDVIKEIHEDCEKRKEQSAVRKRAEILAIAAGNAWPLSH